MPLKQELQELILEIHNSIFANDLEELKNLVKQLPSDFLIDNATLIEVTPLLRAISRGYKEIVMYLLSLGSDYKQAYKDDKNCLDFAKNPEIRETLIKFILEKISLGFYQTQILII